MYSLILTLTLHTHTLPVRHNNTHTPFYTQIYTNPFTHKHTTDSHSDTAPGLSHTPFVYVSEPGNNIGDEGARALADGVKGLKGLKGLYLGGECVIGFWPSPTIANSTRTHYPPFTEWCGFRVAVRWMDVNVGLCW